MLDQWTQLNPALQLTVVSASAGAILYLLQRVWTGNPILPLLGADSTTQRKRLTAIVLAALAGVVSQAGDWTRWQAMIAATVVAYLAGQATFLGVEKTTKTKEEAQ